MKLSQSSGKRTSLVEAYRTDSETNSDLTGRLSVRGALRETDLIITQGYIRSSSDPLPDSIERELNQGN